MAGGRTSPHSEFRSWTSRTPFPAPTASRRRASTPSTRPRPRPEFTPLPPGIYSARVLRGEYCSTKAGADAYRLRFEVTDGRARREDRHSHLDVRPEGAAVHETRPGPVRADHHREAAVPVPRARPGIPRAARGRAAARGRRHRAERRQADRPAFAWTNRRPPRSCCPSKAKGGRSDRARRSTSARSCSARRPRPAPSCGTPTC